jgi:aromatic-L-amino-acid decarboxylase
MKHKKSDDIAAKIPDITFDISIDSLQKSGHEAIDLMVNYFTTIEKSPLLTDKTLAQMEEVLREPLPQGETDAHTVIAECHKKIMTYAVKVGNPRFLGWITTAATPVGAFAEGIAGALNQSVAVSGSAMATAVELQVLRWIKEILGYDTTAGGILVSGGSVANLLALTIARNVQGHTNIKDEGLKNAQNLIVYASEQVHMCIPRALNILGLGTNNMRLIPVDNNYRMDTDELQATILKDKAAGLHPIAVVATAGTVNTGSIDPLEHIAAICKDQQLWFHVDAAYGGFVALSPSYNHLIKGISHADSIAIDPHKWLFVPYEAGCLLVKNPAYMRQTFSMQTDYIHSDTTKIPSFDDVDFADYGIQLSRSFRALKIWMSLKQYGTQNYGRMIEQNIHLAQYMAALIEESNDFELMFPVHLSVICFRYNPKDKQPQAAESTMWETYLDQINRALIPSMRRDRRAYVSSTQLKGHFVLRACIVNHRTQKKDIRDILDIIRELALIEAKNIQINSRNIS